METPPFWADDVNRAGYQAMRHLRTHHGDRFAGQAITPQDALADRGDGWWMVGLIWLRDEPQGRRWEAWLHLPSGDSTVRLVAGPRLAWCPEGDGASPSIGPLAQHAPVAQRPIWYSQWLQAGVAHRGYIYTLDGQEYGRDEAAKLVTRANEERWTWRTIEDAGST